MSWDSPLSHRNQRIKWKNADAFKRLSNQFALLTISAPNSAIARETILDASEDAADVNSCPFADLPDKLLSDRIEKLQISDPDNQQLILSLSRNSIQGKEAALSALFDWLCCNISLENEDEKIIWGAGVKSVLLDQGDFDAFYSAERLLELFKEEPGDQRELVIVQTLFDRYLINSTKKYNPNSIDRVVSAMQGELRKYFKDPPFPLNSWSKTIVIYAILNIVCFESGNLNPLLQFRKELSSPSFESTKGYLLKKVNALRKNFCSDEAIQARLVQLNSALSSLFN